MIDYDVLFVIGACLAWIGVPACVAGWSNGKLSGLGALLLLAAAVHIAAAYYYSPTGYSVSELPEIFFSTLVRIF